MGTMNARSCSICFACLAALMGAGQISRGNDVPASAPTTAAATTLPTTQSAADALIDGLSSADPRERRRAGEELIRLGEEAKPPLEDLLKRTSDPDVAARVQVALAQIDEDRVCGPSYVTLHFKDAAASVVAAELSRQAYAPLKTFPDNLWDDPGIPRVTIDVDHQPFWVAMRQFGQQAGVDLQPYIDDMRLMRSVGRPAGIALVRGPFLIVATQISRMQAIQLGPNGIARSDFSVQMSVYPEPKLVIAQSTTMLEIQEAVDDNGNSLLNPAAGRPGPMFDGPIGIRQMFARLLWPQNPGKKIVKLVGATSFMLQTKSQKMEIANILTAPNQTHTLGGSTVAFQGISGNGKRWEVQISLGGAATAHQMMIQNRLQLLDDAGRSLELRGTSGESRANEMIYHLVFGPVTRGGIDQTGDPSRLVLEVPIETKAVPVQFEFHDLPMPN